MAEIRVDDMSLGMVDGSDGDRLPPGAFYEMNGYEVNEYGYPRKMQDWYKVSATEVCTGSAALAIHFWEREAGTAVTAVMCDGVLWSVDGDYAIDSPLSSISDGQDSGVLSGGTVTPSATADLVATLQVSDQFYFDADTYTARATITSITAASFNVNSYGGGSDSGSYTILRTFSGTEVSIVPAGNRLFVTDGVKRPHWYGDDGDGTDIFREAGLPLLGSVPTVTRAASGGGCSTGTYYYAVCYEDAAGRIGNPVFTQDVACSNATEKLTLAAIPRGPSWATRVHVYRTLVDQDIPYSIAPDLTRLKAASLATSSGNTVITLNSNLPALVTDAHIHRYYTFADSENSFRIIDNATNTVTVAGATAMSETATAMGSIIGGFDRTQAVASGIADVLSDAQLDVDHAAPDENTQPLTGLKYLQKFRGGGRLIAYENDTATKCWISGRTTSARTATGDSTNGEGEFDYWPVFHNAGPQDGDKVVGFLPIGLRLLCVKNRSCWQLYEEPDSVDEWQFIPRINNAGSFSPRSLVSTGDWGWFFGYIDGELDLIRTDGFRAYRVFTRIDRRFNGRQLRYVLTSVDKNSLSVVAAGVIGDRLLLAYPTGSVGRTVNMLFYSISRRTVSIWAGHNAKVFSNLGYPTAGNGAPTLAIARDQGTADSNIYEMFSTRGETNSQNRRRIITPDFSFGEETTWETLEFEIINAATAPTLTVSYSTDGTWPSTGAQNKTWNTVSGGDAVTTTAGSYVIRKHVPAGKRSHVIAFRIQEPAASTTNDYGYKNMKITGDPYKQERGQPT